MPTPRPIIAANCGLNAGNVSEVRRETDQREADAKAEDGGAQRKPHGDDGAERDQQDQHRRQQADPLRPERGALVLRDDPAAGLDREARAVRGVDEAEELVDVGRGDVGARSRSSGSSRGRSCRPSTRSAD